MVLLSNGRSQGGLCMGIFIVNRGASRRLASIGATMFAFGLEFAVKGIVALQIVSPTGTVPFATPTNGLLLLYGKERIGHGALQGNAFALS